MKKFFLLFSFFFGIFGFAQVKDSVKTAQNLSSPKNSILIEDYAKVDEEPIFLNGGIAAFRQKIMEHIDATNIEGSGKITTSVSFVVEKNGSISNIKAVGNNNTFNTEATKALYFIKGKWKPAFKYGQEVRYRYTVPLSIKFE